MALKKKKQRTKKKQDSSRGDCIEAPFQYPWLFIRRGDQNGEIWWCSPSSPPSKASFTKFPRQVIIKEVFNCCYGWLIFLSDENRVFLWNPVKCRLVKLPPLKLEQTQKILHAVLWSPGNSTDHLDPNCMILLFQNNPSSINYCLLRNKEKHWNNVCYGEKGSIFFVNPVIWNDSIYVEDRIHNEIVCINHVNPTDIATTRYCKLPRLSYREYTIGGLVESHGELFYIVITLAGFYYGEISKVEAFKLDHVRMMWEKVTDGEGCVFFFNQRYWVSSNDARRDMKGGFLFCQISRRYWHSYRFADGSISTSSLPYPYTQPISYMADRRLIGEPIAQMNLAETRQCRVDGRKQRKETQRAKIYEEKNGVESLLYRVPNDLIKFITTFLDPVDYLNFRSVSRTCRLLAPQAEWRKASPDFAYAQPLLPWFMITDNQLNIYSFVDTKVGGKYFMNIPDSLVGTKIMHSNNGWVLMYDYIKTSSLYNPITTEIIKLPSTPLQFIESFTSMSFSSSPKSSKCIVVAIDSRVIHILQVGWKEWHTYHGVFLDFYMLSNYSPVLRDGSFYVFGTNASLGVLSVDDDERMSWKVLNTTAKKRWMHSSLHAFLVDCDGKLLLVRIRHAGDLVEVLALNETTLSWEKIDDLGSHNLYLSRSSTFSTPVRVKWMRNTIFFPRLYRDSLVYYSMDTQRYHTVANKDDSVEYANTRELLLSSWIKPSWS